MAAWITVYLQQPAPELNPTSIQEGIAVADWWTLGERFDLEEDEVDEFLDGLQWQAEPLELGVEGQRPLQFHVKTEAEEIREAIDELDELDEVEIPAVVREHLRSTRTIVAIEFGIGQLATMFEAVAFEVAYWLAAASCGVILGPDDQWYDHGAHRWDPITD